LFFPFSFPRDTLALSASFRTPVCKLHAYVYKTRSLLKLDTQFKCSWMRGPPTSRSTSAASTAPPGSGSPSSGRCRAASEISAPRLSAEASGGSSRLSRSFQRELLEPYPLQVLNLVIGFSGKRFFKPGTNPTTFKFTTTTPAL
jgi:hypothetical protein